MSGNLGSCLKLPRACPEVWAQPCGILARSLPNLTELLSPGEQLAWCLPAQHEQLLRSRLALLQSMLRLLSLLRLQHLLRLLHLSR